MARALLATLLAGLLAACGSTTDTSGGSDGGSAELRGERIPPPPFEVLDTALIDAHGESFSITEDTDKPVTLLFFGYTNCPDICGQVMATLAGTMTRLSEDERDRIDVVFVTTDPARDDEEVVGDYVSRYNPSFIGLTGDLEEIVELGRSVGVGIDHGEKMPSGGYEVTHGTRVMMLDPDDEVPVYWHETVSQADLAHDVKLLLAEG